MADLFQGVGLTIAKLEECLKFSTALCFCYIFIAKQLSHDIKQEHSDHILSLSTCRDLRLIATSSMDGTVRIWNSENELVRLVICLGPCA